MTKNENLAIGIDLGTTFSCVGYYNNNRVDIIENKFSGLRTTPSIVTFTDKDRIIGKPGNTSENSIYEVKRLIGRKFKEKCVQNDIENWRFNVHDDGSNRPRIKVKYRNKDEYYYPEEISAMILFRMREIATVRLNQDVTKAVITVPAYFNDKQRQATKDAARIAGLEVLRIINEPTAAALAYGYDKKIIKEQNILIFDLGGGTFDVSIMQINNGEFEVLAIGGDTHLGGIDFNNRLVKYFVNVIKTKYKKDITKNYKAIQRLRRNCEIAKLELSEAVQTTIEIDALFDGEDFNETITREKFEELNMDLFEKTISIVKRTVKDSNLDKNQIDDIILVGGSIRIPIIRKLLSKYFNDKNIKRDINPDEAVAYGAAIQAALLSGNKFTELEYLKHTDVTPLTLGIEVGKEGLMCPLVKRNTPIPFNIIREFSTYNDQDTVRISVYEGENEYVRDNILLGEFTFDILERMRNSESKNNDKTICFDIKFDIDKNGILEISATDKNQISSNKIKITNKDRHQESDMLKMIEKASEQNEYEYNKESKLKLKNELERACLNKKEILFKANLKDKQQEEDLSDMIKKGLNLAENFMFYSEEFLEEEITKIINMKII